MKVVVAYFECPENPAAPATLAKYRDVVCDSEDHTSAQPPMVLGLCVYVVGFYFVFCYAAFVAPRQWLNVQFRERWKFMLTRWRPDVWFWGTVVMTRNLLVAFAGVASSEPRVQLVYVCLVVIAVFAVTAVYQPWRATPLNHYDVLSSIVLVSIGILGLIFVSAEEEIGYAKRLELFTLADRKANMRDSFAAALTFMIGVFIALFVILVVWTLTMMVPARAAKQAAQHAQDCNALIKTLEGCLEREDFLAEAERLVREATAYDRAGLQNFLSKIQADPDSRGSGATDSISISRAKKVQSTTAAPQVVSA